MGLFSKGVELSKLHAEIDNLFNHNITFKVKEQTNDKVVITADIEAKQYFDDGIVVRIVAYKSGTCHVFMVFDQLDPTYENLVMLNEMNDNLSFLSAYISEKDSGKKYLELHGSSIDAHDTKTLASNIQFFINQALADSVLKYLQPLTARTYSN